MPLTDAQIERYSRQIILPEIGGRGQERLLDSQLLILTAAAHLQPALNYLAGAGIGTIYVHSPGPAHTIEAALESARALNPDVTLAKVTMPEFSDLATASTSENTPGTTTLILAGSIRIIELAQSLAARRGATILARFAQPLLIAILPAPPPCIACAQAPLFEAVAEPDQAAGLIAAMAATETIKHILSPGVARLIELHGYEASVRPLNARAARCPRCA